MSDDLVSKAWSLAVEVDRLNVVLTEARAEIERQADWIRRLQTALMFWMPGVDTRLDDATRELAADDAGLLAGYSNTTDKPCWGDGMIDRALAAESELSTLRDMLVLCGELGGMGKEETPADYLRRLIDEVAGVESLRARVREVVGLLADQSECWPSIPDNQAMMTSNGEDLSAIDFPMSSLRAARQLNEDLKDA